MTATHEKKSFEAKLRDKKGRAFRAQGQAEVPGVLYGRKQEPLSISMDRLTLERIFSQLGHSTIFDVVIPEQKSPIPVLLHEVSHHPSANIITHFDLYAVTMDQKIKTEVNINFDGEAPAEADSEKNIVTILDAIEIEALPNDLPEQITVDISDLVEIGDAKYVHDIKLGDKVAILTDPEAALIKVEAVREEEEEPEQPEGAEDEGSEGETSSDEASTDGAEDNSDSSESDESKEA